MGEVSPPFLVVRGPTKCDAVLVCIQASCRCVRDRWLLGHPPLPRPTRPFDRTFMKLIGIVGGIGSGKSFVSRAFQDLGAKWIDADRLAHEAYAMPEVRQAVRERWGEPILAADGQIDRAAIAARVFASTEQGAQDLEWLESLLHPIVRRQLEPQLAQSQLAQSQLAQSQLAQSQLAQSQLAQSQLAQSQLAQWRSDGGVPLVILDAPVLIKAGWHEFCDELVFVSADEETRWRRVQPRGWTIDQWRRREALQTSLEEKQALATVTIENNGSEAETRRQVRDLWNRWVATASPAR
jgi:dephospho-CoA kinase